MSDRPRVGPKGRDDPYSENFERVFGKPKRAPSCRCGHDERKHTRTTLAYGPGVSETWVIDGIRFPVAEVRCGSTACTICECNEYDPY